MNLLEYFDTVFIPAKSEQGMSAHTLYVMRCSCRWLIASLGREAELTDLNDEALSALFVFIRKKHRRSQYTATWNCQRLVTIWRFAWRRGELPPERPSVKALKGMHSNKAYEMRVPVGHTRRKGIPKPKIEWPSGPPRPATPETPLWEFAQRHYAESHDILRRTVDNQFGALISNMTRFLRRPPTIADLTPATINAFLAWLLERVCRVTAHSKRRSCLTLWRYAYEIEVKGIEFPRRVRPIKRPQRIIEGFDSYQMGLLLRAADSRPGIFRRLGCERRLWWTAFLLVAWSTGLRLGDLLRIEWDWIKPDDDGCGRLSLVMSKTSQVIHRILPANAMEALSRLLANMKPRKLCFPLWANRKQYFIEFKLIARAAGLSGTSKFIRRGSASEVERLSSGMGRYHLGHRSPEMFDLAYRVDRIVGRHIPLPPQPTFEPVLRLGFEPTAGKEGAA